MFKHCKQSLRGPTPSRRGWRTVTVRQRRRAAIFVIAMWVLVILSGFVLSFARSMRVEAIASGNRLGQIKASAIEYGAEQYVLGQVDGTQGDAVTLCSVSAQGVAVGDGYFWLIRPNAIDDQSCDFGLTDECSKLNLNTAADSMLVNLPNMTQDVADSIVTWRSTGGKVTGQGADSSFYNGLQPEPYNAKGAPFETVEELLLLKGPSDVNLGGNGTTDPRTMPASLLYGYDLNHDGVVDDQERTAAAATGGSATFNSGAYSDTRGIFPFVTVYSVDPNPATDSSGNPRINVNVVTQANRTAMTTLLTSVVSSSQASAIVARVMTPNRARTPFKSVFAWYQASGLQPTQFGPIISRLTVRSGPIKGLININTAPSRCCCASRDFSKQTRRTSSRTGLRRPAAWLARTTQGSRWHPTAAAPAPIRT